MTVAKTYRLLRAVFNTAVYDELVRRNRCRIPDAGSEPIPKRPTATLTQVFALADSIGPRLRALIVLSTFTGLRCGEVMALRRRNVDLARRTVLMEPEQLPRDVAPRADPVAVTVALGAGDLLGGGLRGDWQGRRRRVDHPMVRLV